MPIVKSTFVANSVFRETPVSAAPAGLQREQLLEALLPSRSSPVNELDYSSDGSDIELCAQEVIECTAICRAIISSSITRHFPASCHNALHSDARSLVRLLIYAPLFLHHIATAQPQSLLGGLVSIVCEDFQELRALFLHHQSAEVSS